MINKLKKWLGIEGIKVELLLPEEVSQRAGVLNGKLRFSSMNAQTVRNVKVVLNEIYSRGRGKEKRTDEYHLGEVELYESFLVLPNEPIEIPFSLPFSMIKSEMDELETKNILLKGLVKTAKTLKNVSSEYRVEAEATVMGTTLSPFDKKTIKIV